ncbi:ferric reductase NAD binding domain-containing protein [Plectosphaerella plurivora]|uniref:Ferric reductase NAD binding domain-containing protein n=1 Tax=Plectosphaerella plurivora TaxID=936078 RepID=A0A9P9ADZ3_9PEZI|nr:ferric reductase NAD binding domain-containing protein [Plectosphaerella plurivora]
MAGSSTSAGGGGHYDPVQLVAFAKRLALNHDSMSYYALGLGILMMFFITVHLIRTVSGGSFSSKSSPLATPFVHSSRVLRRILVRKVPLLPSAGHAWLAIVYITLNTVLTFTPLPVHPRLGFQTNVASRTGWLSMANICLAVLLSLKNTPLGYLTTWSYERLNVLHQIVGYTTMAQCIIHASTYSSYFINQGNMARLRVPEEIYGTVAGFTMLTLVVVGFTIRRWWYEMFYIVHISFFILTLVFLGLHQPETHKRMIFAVAFASAIWFCDRIIRIIRLTLYSINNSATVHPLPHGGTRIVLRKAPIGARSGEHCFIWLPKIRALEMHPFTIAATNPLEFVVASYDGFTQDLHNFAKNNPGAEIKASVEGSYGTFPNPASYDKIVLIAGGSGASFTTGMALNLLERLNGSGDRSVTFVWMVKDYHHLEWFSKHLDTINRALKASFLLYVTRGSPIPAPTTDSNPIQRQDTASTTGQPESRLEKTFDEEKPLPSKPSRILTRALSDPEKSGYESDPTSAGPMSAVSPTESLMTSAALPRTHYHGIPIHYRRPDVRAIIEQAIDSTAADKRILIMGCGPEGLMNEARNTTAGRIRTAGPAVELHCEQFGW